MDRETVIILLAGVVIVFVVTITYYTRYRNRRAAALKGPCGLFTDEIFPDECLGVCPGGGTCTVTSTRRYLVFSTQALTCACVAPLPPLPPPLMPKMTTPTPFVTIPKIGELGKDE